MLGGRVGSRRLIGRLAGVVSSEHVLHGLPHLIKALSIRFPLHAAQHPLQHLPVHIPLRHHSLHHLLPPFGLPYVRLSIHLSHTKLLL